MTCLRRLLPGERDLLAPAAAFPQRYPCLLESVLHGTRQARYDILFAFPRESLTLHADGSLRDEAGRALDGHFLDALDAAWKNEQLPGSPSDDLPFHGGWVLMLAYELAAQIEPTLRLQPSPLLPQALAVRCPAAIIVDHQLGLLAVDVYDRSLDWDRFLDGCEPVAHLNGGRHTYDDLARALDAVKAPVGAGVWSDHPDLRQVIADLAASDPESITGALPTGAGRC